MAKFDVYQTITDSVIAALSEGTAPWRKGWIASASRDVPMRACGKPYRGINVLLLWLSAMAKGYENPVWMTFKQAQAEGGCVRKGEKGTMVTFFRMFDAKDKATGDDKKIPVIRSYTVFNVEQIDGLGDKRLAKPVDTGARSIASLEAFFAATKATVRTEGNSACYIPSLDIIKMPPIKQFLSAENYYGTLAHEVAHWTGHESRLNRVLSQKREEYAFEELVAELSAAFTTATLGIPMGLDQTAAYIGSWLRALQNDTKFVFQSASAAQKATDHILELAGFVADEDEDEEARAA